MTPHWVHETHRSWPVFIGDTYVVTKLWMLATLPEPRHQCPWGRWRNVANSKLIIQWGCRHSDCLPTHRRFLHLLSLANVVQI